MLNLIVHADDFGMTTEMNQGIKKAFTDGIVTSASIMANGAAFKNAVDIARLHPNLDIGVHLTLVGERPLSNPKDIPSLVDDEGQFVDHVTTLTKRSLFGKIDPEDVRRELEKQIIMVKDAGINISHLDSHQHTHILPAILPIVVDLVEKYDIPAIRFPFERIKTYMFKEGLLIKRVIELFVLNRCCQLGERRIKRKTNHFTGFIYGGNLNKDNLQTVLNHLPSEGTCELMCHPGLGAEDDRHDHWGYRWEDELRALTDPDIMDFINKKGIILTSYGQLEQNKTLIGSGQEERRV